jgi:hypothetical protein
MTVDINNAVEYRLIIVPINELSRARVTVAYRGNCICTFLQVKALKMGEG